MSLNISLSHLSSVKIKPLSRACVTPYYYSIVSMYFAPFLRYSASNNRVTNEIWVKGTFKVIENDTIRKLGTVSY